MCTLAGSVTQVAVAWPHSMCLTPALYRSDVRPVTAGFCVNLHCSFRVVANHPMLAARQRKLRDASPVRR